MKAQAFRALLTALGLAGMVLVSGCRSLFVQSGDTTVSRWRNYDEIEAAFQKIVPHQTRVQDLPALGFDPKASPNIKILNYVDIIQFFMPNPGIRLEDLAPAVRECIETRESSRAYLVELHDVQDQRHGNLFLDIFGFKRKTHESGWRFSGLILIQDDLVVYKLASGEPQVSSESKQVKPLGPLQELNFNASEAVNYAK